MTMGGLGKASRFLGNWADLSKNGRAGFEQPVWCEGMLSAGGKDYPLEKGLGLHEKVLIGDAWVRGKSLERSSRHYWIWSLTEKTQIFTYVKKAAGIVFGHVNTEGQHEEFGAGQVKLDELEYWDDPRTVYRVPCRWHINMASDGNVSDLEIVAGARFIYNYLMVEGHLTFYGFMCRANGRIQLKNGSVVQVKDMLTYVECGLFVTPLGIG